jgi:hypothetical protein
LDDVERADLMCGIRELKESRHGYDKAAAYYDGKVPEVFSSLRLRRALAIHGLDFDLNFAKTPVNAVVDRLEIAAITSTDEATDVLISQLWQDNALDLEMPDLHRRACEFGDAYLIELPVEDDKGNTVRVDMYYNSPQTVRIVYSEENPRLKAFAIKRWRDGPYVRAELYYDDRIERWTTGKNQDGSKSGEWSHWTATPEDGEPGDPESWVIPHDYGEVPVFHYRTDRPYGVPEHFGAYGPQNAITKLQATHMGTVDYQGFPQRYALTDSATTDTSDLDPGDWDDQDFPVDANATGVKDIGDDSSLKSGPGEVWLLRGFKAVGEFNAAQPAVFWDPIGANIRAMAQITTTPTRMFEHQTMIPRSGESYKAEDDPFTRKVRNRQVSFGATHREAFVFALRCLGVENPVVTVRWTPAATVDDQSGWLTITEKIKNGVPRRQALIEAGYRAEQVDLWFSGTDDAELERRVEILAKIAAAAQQLGTAATLGVLDQGQVTALLAEALAGIDAPEPPDSN